MNIPDSAVAEEVKIIMKELYEQSPSSATGQTIASRYGFVLDGTIVSTSSSEVSFGENDGSDWKEVHSWQSDNAMEQKPQQKRVGPRNPDRSRTPRTSRPSGNFENQVNKDVEADSSVSLPNNHTDRGFASLSEESSKCKQLI